MNAQLESALEARLLKRVRTVLGGQVHKCAPTTRGMPDRIVLLPGGRLYLVELKTLNGRVSDAQLVWHERAAALGTEVVVLSGPNEIDRWVGARSAELHDSHGRRRKNARSLAVLQEDPVPCGDAAVHGGHEWSYSPWQSSSVVHYWCRGGGSAPRR